MSNDHIRTDTSPEREAHLRFLAGTDNAMRDAMALVDKERAEKRRFERAATRLLRAMQQIAQQSLREAAAWWDDAAIEPDHAQTPQPELEQTL